MFRTFTRRNVNLGFDARIHVDLQVSPLSVSNLSVLRSTLNFLPQLHKSIKYAGSIQFEAPPLLSEAHARCHHNVCAFMSHEVIRCVGDRELNRRIT